MDPQSNVDFYTRALGLRLVKKTVNFGTPESYHVYYGRRHRPSRRIPGPGPRHDLGVAAGAAVSKAYR
jgi:catechol 2,3-dioxygenase-like lactoylglutathione lyase family enzyme